MGEFTRYRIPDSPETEEDVANIIRFAKRNCSVEQLVRHPIPLESTYTVNGSLIEVNLA